MKGALWRVCYDGCVMTGEGLEGCVMTGVL